MSKSTGEGMRVFKTKLFSRWAEKEALTDLALRAAIDELKKGLMDADLGAHVYKKRASLAGRGKRGGARTLIAFGCGSFKTTPDG